MLNFETVEPQTKADASIIFIHGLGANGFDLMDLVPVFHLPKTCAIRFIFPHAPSMPITINGGMQMPAWYDITGFSKESREDLAGLEQSRLAIETLILHEINRGISADRIMLAGFSQGGALTLFTGLQSKHSLAGLIVLSAYCPAADHLMSRFSPTSYKIPIFMAHGSRDPVVMYQWGEMTKDGLLQQGFNVEWHSYPMGHEICEAEIKAVSHFIQSHLNAAFANTKHVE